MQSVAVFNDFIWPFFINSFPFGADNFSRSRHFFAHGNEIYYFTRYLPKMSFISRHKIQFHLNQWKLNNFLHSNLNNLQFNIFFFPRKSHFYDKWLTEHYFWTIFDNRYIVIQRNKHVGLLLSMTHCSEAMRQASDTLIQCGLRNISSQKWVIVKITKEILLILI